MSPIMIPAQAASGTREVSDNVANLSEAVTTAGNAAEQVLASGGQLAGQAEVMNTSLDRIVATIRQS